MLYRFQRQGFYAAGERKHLPFEMLPPNLLDTCKVIFVSRNPKDTCVSYFHHAKNIEESMENGEFIGTFADFAETFLDGNCAYGSYWTMLKVGRNVYIYIYRYFINFFSI